VVPLPEPTPAAAAGNPTTPFWQALAPSVPDAELAPPWHTSVPVRLPDGRVLRLPVRQRPGDAGRAVASLIANQASFEVVDALVDAMLPLARAHQPQALVGLPTLGMVFAPPLARALGHPRWVPFGYSRKFWYDEALSVDVASITSPAPGKRLYLDPHQLPRLAGQRVVLIDDAVSTGTTLNRAWDLAERAGATVAGAVVAMCQGQRWRQVLGADRAGRVAGAFDSPLLVRRADGWHPEA
jgi:adenine/guanine phosphoribosyltransferase-like PRPP-binding protein